MGRSAWVTLKPKSAGNLINGTNDSYTPLSPFVQSIHDNGLGQTLENSAYALGMGLQATATGLQNGDPHVFAALATLGMTTVAGGALGELSEIASASQALPDLTPAIDVASDLGVDLKSVNGSGIGSVADATESAVPAQLTAGQTFEADQLGSAGLSKNTSVLRPTADQVDSATFQAVVGDPAYTPGGQLKGTIFDSTDNGYLEIKGGSSPLDSSYQLRLQTYFSLTDNQPYTIMTSRPISPSFQQYLDFWGVNVVPPVK